MAVPTEHDDFAFDVRGHLTLRGVLAPPAAAALRAVVLGARVRAAARPEALLEEPAVRALLVQPLLVRYLNHLVGPGFRLDRAPALLCADACDTRAPLAGGNEPRDPAVAYHFKDGVASSQAVRVLGFGRIGVSEKEVPILLVNLVKSG
jgi:hypothetical protein